MKRLTMAEGPEMNSQEKYELSMEELGMVSGGAEEPDEIDFPGSLIATALKYVLLFVSKYALNSFDALWNYIQEHENTINLMIVMSNPIKGWKYLRYNKNQKKEFWRKAYNQLPGASF